jgi:hypothetical protein
MAAAVPTPAVFVVREDVEVITQTITRPYTTLITLVTLGLERPTPSPTPSPEPVEHEPQTHSEHTGLTNAEIGAIVGAIIGFVIIVLGLIYCFADYKRDLPDPVYYKQTYSYGDSQSSNGYRTPSVYDDARVKKPRKAKVHRHHNAEPEYIPGGPKYPAYRAIPIPNPRNNPPINRRGV